MKTERILLDSYSAASDFVIKAYVRAVYAHTLQVENKGFPGGAVAALASALADTNVAAQCSVSELSTAMRDAIIELHNYDATRVSIDYARPQAFSQRVLDVTGRSADGIVWLYSPDKTHGAPLPLTFRAVATLAEYQNANGDQD